MTMTTVCMHTVCAALTILRCTAQHCTALHCVSCTGGKSVSSRFFSLLRHSWNHSTIFNNPTILILYFLY